MTAAFVAVATTTTGAERSSRLANVTVSVSGAVLASTDTAGEGSRVCAAGGIARAGSSWPALTASMWVGAAEQAVRTAVAVHSNAAADFRLGTFKAFRVAGGPVYSARTVALRSRP